MNLNLIALDVFEESDEKIRRAFSAFIKQPSEYRNSFLQPKYNTAFDGYSYMGQKDSLNQYDTDMLHSFVLSDLHSADDFPQEFQDFLSEEWLELTAHIRSIESKLIKKHNLPFGALYENDDMAYMMSCNYYPKIKVSDIPSNNTRLSAHTDASLFTTFPYGIQSGLSYFDKNKFVAVGEKENMIMFAGYFSEFMSNGEFKALQHQVELPFDLDSDRYSFAVFSIPKPESIFWINNQKFSGKDYYAKYLSLF